MRDEPRRDLYVELVRLDVAVGGSDLAGEDLVRLVEVHIHGQVWAKRVIYGQVTWTEVDSGHVPTDQELFSSRHGIAPLVQHLHVCGWLVQQLG